MHCEEFQPVDMFPFTDRAEKTVDKFLMNRYTMD